MEAPFNKNLKNFLRSIKDPEKKEAIQHVFLSDRPNPNIKGLRINRVNQQKTEEKVAS
jgi:hypothetical protein